MNTSVINIVNYMADFFTEMTDIQVCTDPIINKRLRELMIISPTINSLIIPIISETVYQMQSIKHFDQYDLTSLTTFDTISELARVMSHGWFNYDKYIGQYSEQEIGDLIFLKIQDALSFESERLFTTMNYNNRALGGNEQIVSMFDTMRLSTMQ